MSAQPLLEPDPDDPIEILRILPEEYHAQFRAEYAAAVEEARRPEHFRELFELLRLWRLRAIAYSDPGYEARLRAVSVGCPQDFAPAVQVVPNWPVR